MESGISLTPNLVSSLLSWYDANKRDLPWRGASGSAPGESVEPYATLVSEFMLQQTTVPAVLPYFRKWMVKYPDIGSLAEAVPEQVLRDWEGLGYYSRARNLHAAARSIFHQYRGSIPEDPVKLKKLPGVGEYTASAIASIAFGARTPALDANNYRVLSRVLAVSNKKHIALAASRIVPADRPGDFNQALMDLGTAICTSADPRCSQCPLSSWCRAYRTDRVQEYPEKKRRPETIHVQTAIGIIVDKGRVLVQKRPGSGLFAGLWEFPGGKIQPKAQNPKSKETGGSPESRVQRKRGDQEPGTETIRGETVERETPEEAVVREVREETGLRIQMFEKLGIFNHSYTRFRVKLHVFLCRRKAGKLHHPEAKWVTAEELERLPMPSANRRIVKKLEEYLTAEDVEEKSSSGGKQPFP